MARAVLEALVEKYADAGIESIEDIKILTLDPFSRIGTAAGTHSVFWRKTRVPVRDPGIGNPAVCMIANIHPRKT